MQRGAKRGKYKQEKQGEKIDLRTLIEMERMENEVYSASGSSFNVSPAVLYS